MGSGFRSGRRQSVGRAGAQAPKPPTAMPSSTRAASMAGRPVAVMDSRFDRVSSRLSASSTCRRSRCPARMVRAGADIAASRPDAATSRPAVPTEMPRSAAIALSRPTGRNSALTRLKLLTAMETPPARVSWRGRRAGRCRSWRFRIGWAAHRHRSPTLSAPPMRKAPPVEGSSTSMDSARGGGRAASAPLSRTGWRASRGRRAAARWDAGWADRPHGTRRRAASSRAGSPPVRPRPGCAARRAQVLSDAQAGQQQARQPIAVVDGERAVAGFMAFAVAFEQQRLQLAGGRREMADQRMSLRQASGRPGMPLRFR